MESYFDTVSEATTAESTSTISLHARSTFIMLKRRTKRSENYSILITKSVFVTNRIYRSSVHEQNSPNLQQTYITSAVPEPFPASIIRPTHSLSHKRLMST